MNTQNYPVIIIFITANACDKTPIAYIFLIYFSLFHKHHFIGRVATIIQLTRRYNKYNVTFLVGDCILQRMYPISKYRQPLFATVLQLGLPYFFGSNPGHIFEIT
jgi:hypothetical protein